MSIDPLTVYSNDGWLKLVLNCFREYLFNVELLLNVEFITLKLKNHISISTLTLFL